MEVWAQVAAIISAIAILISAIVAFLAFANARYQNRRLATFDMVMQTFMAEVGTELYDDFRDVIRRDVDPKDGLCLTNIVEFCEEFSKERNSIIDQLNQYELISLGIHQKLFDEKFYKLWFHRQFLRDYESLREFVEKIQEDHPSRYFEFRTLYIKWKDNPHPVNRPSRWKMMWWVLRGEQKKLKAAMVGIRVSEKSNSSAQKL